MKKLAVGEDEDIEEFLCGSVYEPRSNDAKGERRLIGVVFGISSMERECSKNKDGTGSVTSYNQKKYSSELWGLWVEDRGAVRGNGIGKELFLWFCRCVKCYIYILSVIMHT